MSLILEIKSFCQETEELLDFSGFNIVCFFCCLLFPGGVSFPYVVLPNSLCIPSGGSDNQSTLSSMVLEQ